MTTASELGNELLAELRFHSARFSPIYEGYLSDHGPMAALAMHGLGRSAEEVLGWLGDYRQRLQPLATAPAAYQRLLAETTDDLNRLGAHALLQRHLPELISGWPTNAYHPLIRLAYGYQFGIDEEIVAGLAYLRWCGRRPALEALAERAIDTTASPDRLFHAMSACATNVAPDRRFDDCLDLVEQHPEFSAAARRVPNALRQISRLALRVFDESHDFFALHLVTGAHAYRVLSEFIGPEQEETFTLGILAGYAAVGAPELTPAHDESTSAPSEQQTRQFIEGLSVKNEHDIKIAYSCLKQSEHFEDALFLEIAARYLRGR